MSKRKAGTLTEVAASLEKEKKSKEKVKKEKKEGEKKVKEKKEKKAKKEKNDVASAFQDDLIDNAEAVAEIFSEIEKPKKEKKEKEKKEKKEKKKKESKAKVEAFESEAQEAEPDEDEEFWNKMGLHSEVKETAELLESLPPLEEPKEVKKVKEEVAPSLAEEVQEPQELQELQEPQEPEAEEEEPEEALGPEELALRAQEAEEAQLEMDPLRSRILQLNPEERQTLQNHGELHFLRRCCEAQMSCEEHELRVQSEVPGAARAGELAARALLASNLGQAVYLRVMPEDLLPGISVLDIPASGGVDPKELRRFGDVVAAFLRPKEPLKARPALTGAQAELSRQLNLSVDQAVEVRYADQWYHATVVGFTKHGTVLADYFRTDGSRPDREGGEIEVGAADIRAAQTARPVVRVDSGKLVVIGELRARQSARLHAAVQAERRAVASGTARARDGLAEQILDLVEDGCEDEVEICGVDLAEGSPVSRLQLVTKLTEALVEVLPGGRRALMCGRFEERQRARCLLELLPKGGPFGELASIPIELQDGSSHLLVPSVAVQAVRDRQKDIEIETGTLIFWLPLGAPGPRRQRHRPIEKGAWIEAQYRGKWHAATVISATEESVQISWQYDGSLDEVEVHQVREKGQSHRAAWLRSHRFMVVLGGERPRLSAVLRGMAVSEQCCPQLWSSEEALQDAQAEVFDGHDEEDVTFGFEAQTLPSLRLDGAWLVQTGAILAVERAVPCAIQLVGSKLMLAGSTMERERAKEYLLWAQQSRKGSENDVSGLRGGGRLSVYDADMREDVQPVLLTEADALWLSADRVAEIEKDTQTFLVFDTGGGSALEGRRRLLVCGATELQRAEAATAARESHQVQAAASERPDPWTKLNTMPWPQSINEWGQLQKVLWPNSPKLKPGWIRCMSRSQRLEYYIRLSDKTQTFDISVALAGREDSV